MNARKKAVIDNFIRLAQKFFGLEGPDIDAELIMLSATLFEKLGLMPHISLQINSLGSPESRTAYRTTLVRYLTQHKEILDEDSQRRLTTNPLRILDSKNPALQTLINNAPKLIDHLDENSRQHFEKLQHYLKNAGIPFTINPCLVRGLDYYTKTVFEWVTNELGAQGTVCAGGRYDGLVEQLGGKATPALGWALGMERTILLMQQLQAITTPEVDIYFMSDSENTFAKALSITHGLHKTYPTLRILLHCGGGSLKNQFKKADKSGARLALILGEQELQQNAVTLKYLRENLPQRLLTQEELIAYLKTVPSPAARSHENKMNFTAGEG